jgi:hypothetical protein
MQRSVLGRAAAVVGHCHPPERRTRLRLPQYLIDKRVKSAWALVSANATRTARRHILCESAADATLEEPNARSASGPWQQRGAHPTDAYAIGLAAGVQESLSRVSRARGAAAGESFDPMQEVQSWLGRGLIAPSQSAVASIQSATLRQVRTEVVPILGSQFSTSSA